MAAKTIKHILSPAQIRAGDRRRLARQEYEDRLKDERRRNEVLLAPDGNVDVRNAEAQRGRRLSRHDFVRKLQKLNPNLWYERSNNYPDQGGIYIASIESPYGKRMVAGFPHDFINEFAIRLTVPKLQPAGATAAHWQTIQEVDQQIPGWRQVLLKLIIDGLIAPSDAEREFKISQGQVLEKWQEANALKERKSVEASSTTVNISGTGANPAPSIAASPVGTKHSHGPNFGRYVEGCAACIAKYPDGKVKRTRTVKPATDKDAEIARLKAELSKSYTQQVEKTSVPDDVNRELANIMLRRETKQLREEEAADARKAQARAEWLTVEQEQERKTKIRQDNCPHMKPNKQSAIVGSQIHNNGMTRPFCPHCGKIWPWQRPSHEQMPTSIDG